MDRFEDPNVWQEARRLRRAISAVAREFPKTETYALKDQLLRSSRSTTANIAEGFGWFHYQENAQFCRQARGSLAEALDQLICARDVRISFRRETCRTARTGRRRVGVA